LNCWEVLFRGRASRRPPAQVLRLKDLHSVQGRTATAVAQGEGKTRAQRKDSSARISLPTRRRSASRRSTRNQSKPRPSERADCAGETFLPSRIAGAGGSTVAAGLHPPESLIMCAHIIESVPNFTLTAPSELPRTMKARPEIKWCEAVRRFLAELIHDLERIEA